MNATVSRVMTTTKNYNEPAVIQMSRYQDKLDVFIHIIILRLPTAFVLINMTVMIWLVQTIYTSNNNQTLPRSLYYFAPVMAGKAMVNLQIGGDNGCKVGWQQIIIKTFPSIAGQSINHLNLTKWKQSNVFCAKFSQQVPNFTLSPSNCPANTIYCAGLCANSREECPITSIYKLSAIEPANPNQKQFYRSKDGLYKYLFSRESRNNLNTYVTGISAQYQYRCANQYRYYDSYQTFLDYWNQTKTCGAEGFLSSDFYHTFDSMDMSQFLLNNGVWTQSISKATANSVTQLGYINNLNFKNNTQCANAIQSANSLQKFLGSNTSSALNSKTLLIMSFVLFTLCWIWLLVLYCCECPIVLKNIPIIIMSIIQLIAFIFIFSQNKSIFEMQDAINEVARCIDEPMTVFDNWSSGLFNRKPLIGIIFMCTSFLLFQFVAYFIHFCLYQPYNYANGGQIEIQQYQQQKNGKGFMKKQNAVRYKQLNEQQY